ncbi:MAG: OsmC family protein, partial [Fimbriimonadaceae bacterium]|nr:OsmC family protein [Fimbriimonadaceae bacterium]
MAQVHKYPVSVRWSGGRTGEGFLRAERSGVPVDLGVPDEFGGDGKPGTNPEELLTSAIAGCYSITFGIVAENRRLPVVEYTATAEGEVEGSGASFAYKRITIRPRIVVAADADDAAVKTVEDLAHKADAYCIVTNAVRGKAET